MKTKIFTALAAVAGAVLVTGCVETVSGTRTAAVPLQNDRIEGRYQRTLDQVYRAAVQVVNTDGVVVTEFIPHDTTNTVRSLQGKVNQDNVWVRVEAIDPNITSVVVQARTKWGNSDVEQAAQVEREIALQLARGGG